MMVVTTGNPASDVMALVAMRTVRQIRPTRAIMALDGLTMFTGEPFGMRRNLCGVVGHVGTDFVVNPCGAWGADGKFVVDTPGVAVASPASAEVAWLVAVAVVVDFLDAELIGVTLEELDCFDDLAVAAAEVAGAAGGMNGKAGAASDCPIGVDAEVFHLEQELHVLLETDGSWTGSVSGVGVAGVRPTGRSLRRFLR